MQQDKKTDLIIPAAGRSSRFPGVKPKWMLTHPSGKLMVISSISGLNLENIKNIYFTVLEEHLEKQKISEKDIFKAFTQVGIDSKRIKILALKKPTENQPQTIAKTIEHFGIEGPIYIKDPDNYFVDAPQAQNSIATFDLQHSGNMNGANKSYVTVDEYGFINNIVEKKIISSTFCVGGQSFMSSREFLSFFNNVDSSGNDFYVSHIIFNMLLEGKRFLMSNVEKYDDWGTLEDWNDYKKKFATIFIDLDGVLVKNSSRYFTPFWGQTEGIIENITAVNELHDTGKVKVIITTSRDRSYAEVTKEQLKDLGIYYDEIVFDLPHTKRIIINDFAKTNPYKSCEAINISRDSNNLRELLYSVIKK